MRIASLIRSAIVGTVVAVGAVAIVYLLADAISGPLLADQFGADEPQETPLAGALIATIVGGVGGTVLAVISSRFKPAATIFVGICVVGLVLYGIFAMNAADSQSTGIWLNVMHLVAAAPIVGQLTGWLRSRPAADAASDAAPTITGDTGDGDAAASATSDNG